MEDIKIRLQHYGRPTDKTLRSAVNNLVIKYSLTFALKCFLELNPKHVFRNSHITTTRCLSTQKNAALQAVCPRNALLST
jgi:hypothetical protein